MAPIFIAAALAGAAAPAASEPAPENTIVVSGTYDETRGDLERQARAIVEPYNGHIARYEDPVCMGITGLSRETGEAIVARFRETATTAGIKLSEPGCKPNLLVVVSPEPKAFIEEIKRKRPAFLAPLSGVEKRRLFENEGPVWVWRNTVPERADGAPVKRISSIEIDGKIGATSKDAFIAENVQLSRLTSAIRYSMDQTFLVLDRAALPGMDSAQLGDFIALTGLTAVDLGQVEKFDRNSILRLFSDEVPPPESSDVDRAYLAAVYAGEAGMNARQKLADISGRMTRNLLGEPGRSED